MVVLNDDFDSINTAFRIDLVLLMGQPGQYLHKIDIIILQTENTKLSLINAPDIKKGLFLNDRILILLKRLTNNGHNNLPPTRLNIARMIINKIRQRANNVLLHCEKFRTDKDLFQRLHVLALVGQQVFFFEEFCYELLEEVGPE